MKEHGDSNSNRLSDDVENFLSEASKGLIQSPQPPTFLQRLKREFVSSLQEVKEAWPDLTFDSKVSLIMAGVGTVAAGIAVMGGSIWLAGEFTSNQNLKDIAIPSLLIGGGGLGTYVATYVTMSALCYFD